MIQSLNRNKSALKKVEDFNVKNIVKQYENIFLD